VDVGGGSVEILDVDITTLDVDGVVNAANNALVMGGGVCGAIFSAAGPAEMSQACAAVAPCPTGQARITPGFRLPARFVIHAVGPVWHGGGDGEAELLASAYQSSLRLAADQQLDSIAFPAISTGVYGYPLAPAIRIAVATCGGFLAQERPRPARIVFAVRGSSVAAAFEAELVRLAG